MASSAIFKHGVEWSSVPTSVRIPTEEDGVKVAIGTAPVHRLPGGASKVNKLILIDSLATAVKTVGESKNWDAFTLSEVIYKAFVKYGVGPAVLINVLDPNIHYKTVAPFTKSVVDGRIVTSDDAIYDSVVVKNISGDKTFVLGSDYLLSYNKDENLVVTVLKTGAAATEKSLSVGYDKINPSAVTDADIIGGFDAATDSYTGLELIDLIPSEFGLVPGLILTPGRSSATVVAVVDAKAQLIEGRFRCYSVIDLDTSVVKTVSEVFSAKNKNNIVSPRQIACWPNVIVDGVVSHLSVDYACVARQVDASNRGAPFESASNKPIKIDGLCLADGTPVKLPMTQANYLNGIGIVAAVNDRGWRLWGNRSAAFPGSTDVKDVFIPIGRMFDYVGNGAAIDAAQAIDKPAIRRFIEQQVDSRQLGLNALMAEGALLGGRIEFRKDDNPKDRLLAGYFVFHIWLLPPLPAERIEYRLEIDVNYFRTLFSGN